ncbi:hypothetical protein O3G_MSEX013451 [Manduca sexta]|uniref:EGF-like domain-containing protein n=1 Tax=Manduca sexta TaxID=7130 RepID=A0A921ZS88_MANSE|nr:hypothetical protein O3G_MSEX013451 [Manduca sexta]KAG6462761.1 hypothetical protein O3G_MSEX013451 [Manduca sexta]
MCFCCFDIMTVDVVWGRRGAVGLAGCYILLTIILTWSPRGALAAVPVGPSERPEAYFNGSSYIRLSRPISLKQLVGLSFRTCVGCYILLTIILTWSPRGALAAVPVGPSERPEAYFNGSSYIRLSRPISLKQLVGLSFRTCVGGELFSQRFEGYTLHVTALFEQVVVSWARPMQPPGEVGLPKETLDNRWHWVALRYKPNPPSLLLEVDRDSQVISNVTWNPELLSPGALEAGGAVVLVGNQLSGCIHEGPQLEFHAAGTQLRNVISNVTWNPELLSPGALEAGGAVVLVGNQLSGCIHEGPQLEFHAAGTQLRNVVFGHCPLTTDDCIDRKDVLRIPPKDHCYNEPCMRHGTCISRHDRYECHCTARYTGNNCEVDAGDPCASAPCLHGARCAEDARGDYTCHCTPHYHGTNCELEESLDPQCVAGPCRNNGSCSVPPGADTYVCACPPGNGHFYYKIILN